MSVKIVWCPELFRDYFRIDNQTFNPHDRIKVLRDLDVNELEEERNKILWVYVFDNFNYSIGSQCDIYTSEIINSMTSKDYKAEIKEFNTDRISNDRVIEYISKEIKRRNILE